MVGVQDVPVAELEVGDIINIYGYAFRILELYPVFENALGNPQRHFRGEACGDKKPGGAYNLGTYAAGDSQGMAARQCKALPPAN